MKKDYKYIIYSPFINTGGGKTLLLQLLNEIQNYPNSLVIVDSRISFSFKKNKKCDVLFIRNTLFSFIQAEYFLYSHSSKKSKILCLHGAPPLIKNLGYVVVFFHNKLHIFKKISFFNVKENLKNYFFTKSFNFCDEVIVQTDSMIYLFNKFFNKNHVKIKLTKKSFFNFFVNKNNTYKKKFDFIYVADASPHKNQMRLVEAWILLSMEKIKPSLVLTIPSTQQKEIDVINKLIKKYSLNIYNISDLSLIQINNLYAISKRLVYPSLSESFGLPLIEASRHNLYIVASELDYVRDVCEPNYTFDPLSALSISRAIKHSLGILSKIKKPYSAKYFLNNIFKDTK